MYFKSTSEEEMKKITNETFFFLLVGDISCISASYYILNTIKRLKRMYISYTKGRKAFEKGKKKKRQMKWIKKKKRERASTHTREEATKLPFQR